jgi:uncharacterized protein YjbJ (UPF0337 family)
MVDTDRITGAAKELGGKLQGAVGDLTGSHRDSAEGRFREAQGAAENAYGQAKDTVRHAADRAQDYAGEAQDHAEDAYERGSHYLRRGTRQVSHQVAEYPLASLVIAGLVGFGLGLLVSANRDRDHARIAAGGREPRGRRPPMHERPRSNDVTLQTPVSPLAAAAQADTRAVVLNQVSWGAIFAGAVTALVTQVILNLLGVSLGLASVGTNAADNPAASTVSIGAGLWFVISGIVASVVGGAIAGRLSGKPLPGAAALHGLVAWAVTTLVVIYLLASAASGLVGGALSTVSGAIGSLSKISNPLEGIEDKVRQQAAGQDPQAARDAAVAAVRALITGDASQKQQAEARAADALAKAQNIPVEQARQQVQDYQKQYDEAVATAKRKAEATAVAAKSAATQGAFYAALALILGAAAAFFGGRLGAPTPTTPLGTYDARRV